MHSEINQISPVLVEVKIEIPWDRVRKDLDESFRTVGRTARIKGFRPGKVPPKVVRQIFGRQVKGEVTANLVEQGLMFAVTEHELQIVAQPEVEAPMIEDGEPLSFSAKVEVRPRIDKVDLGGLDLVRPSAEVENAAVDAEVERVRHEHAQVRVPEPMRGARNGDVLLIDYAVSVDGEDKPEMGAEGRPVELGRDQLIEAFEKGLAGLSPDERKEISVEFGEDHEREELRGKTAIFSVHVKELKEKLLPEADDELAKDVGDFETLLELRLDIRKQLEDLARRRAEAGLKEALVDKLVETNDIPVPPSMVRQEEQRMMYELAAFMQMAGQPPSLDEELHKSMHGRAERKVRAAILLGAVAREQGIDVGDEDVEARLLEIAEGSGKHVAKVRAEYQGERRETLENQILEEKLMDYLMKQASISDAAPDAGGEGEEGEDGEEGEEETE